MIVSTGDQRSQHPASARVATMAPTPSVPSVPAELEPGEAYQRLADAYLAISLTYAGLARRARQRAADPTSTRVAAGKSDPLQQPVRVPRRRSPAAWRSTADGAVLPDGATLRQIRVEVLQIGVREASTMARLSRGAIYAIENDQRHGPETRAALWAAYQQAQRSQQQGARADG